MALPVWAGSEVSSPGGAGLGGAAGPLSQPSGPLFQACHPGPCPPHSPQLGQARGVSRRGAGSGSCSRQCVLDSVWGSNLSPHLGSSPLLQENQAQEKGKVKKSSWPGEDQPLAATPRPSTHGIFQMAEARPTALQLGRLWGPRAPASGGDSSSYLPRAGAKGRVPGWSGWRRVSCGDARRWRCASFCKAPLPGSCVTQLS
ncbi:uncharacterized protein LOC119522931 isoform X6 [Choloepus didactylus]|uniref:uncharacterized protein LOC119522931 isoform X6 n=1 Tax=Choloepus didactylus TaxID=27675 RepID=UPI00189F63EF|nr:uncharacterized protein LOC119522931 isoform X6 [Choloepus didactylus]XP_037677586.1 uncharacterized protein LOC119522931 isoform X6 [Choloepus didactylus]